MPHRLSVIDKIMEKWKEILGLEGYYSISSFGRVRRDRDGVGTNAGRIIRGSISKRGYFMSRLGKDSKQGHFLHHKLVAEAFIGPRLCGMELNHKDGNKLNNHVENLEYVSHCRNMKHAHSVGLSKNFGETHALAILSENTVRKIIDDYARGGTSYRLLGLKYGIKIGTIASICSGMNWRHIPRPSNMKYLPPRWQQP